MKEQAVGIFGFVAEMPYPGETATDRPKNTRHNEETGGEEPPPY